MTHSHNIVDSGSHFVIDPLLRTITSVAEEVVLVEGDHNSERYTFEIPRMIDGHDMSLADRIEIHYDNIAKNKRDISEGLYIATGVTVNGDMLEFGWLITENVTKFAGTTQFWINFVCLDDDDNIIYSWGTSVFKSIRVLPNNNNTDSIIAKFPDVLTQWKEEILNSFDVPGESHITHIESPTEDGRMLCLRDLVSGVYILHGWFKPFSSATVSYTFSNNVLCSINRDDDVSYVQVLYPKNNTIQYMEITDDSVSREDAKLANAQPSVNLTEEQIAQAVADYLDKNPVTSGSTAIIGTIELLADNWLKSESSDRLYYQENVVIDDIPENFNIESCQVDLTPSVEQLIVFYEKDLTFVTENEEGNVTVYAIGQKPEHNYVIQVTLTEVSE